MQFTNQEALSEQLHKITTPQSSFSLLAPTYIISLSWQELMNFCAPCREVTLITKTRWLENQFLMKASPGWQTGVKIIVPCWLRGADRLFPEKS